MIVDLSGESGELGHRLQPAQIAGQEVLTDHEVAEPVPLCRLDLTQDVVELLTR